MTAGSKPAPRPGGDELASSPAPECFAGNRYYDPVNRTMAVKLLPGEYHVSTGDILQATVLGSCVAACIRDTRLRIGGMNHFMLPQRDGAGPASGAARYGSFAMEMLIGHLLALGARREHLEAKVFGGGKVMSGLNQANIGQRNAAFVLEYLRGERIPVVARDLADIHPRKIHFYPATGRAFVKRLRTLANSTIADRETAYRERLEKPFDGKAGRFD